MKCILFGGSVMDYDMSDRGGQKGTSAKVSLVKGRPVAGEGRIGLDAGIYKVTDVELARKLLRELASACGPVVADVDLDIKGSGQNKEAVVVAAEILGPLAQFNLGLDGLSFRQAASGSRPAASPALASARS